MDLRARITVTVLMAAVLLTAVLMTAAGGCAGQADSPPGRTVSIEGDVTVGDITWRVLNLRRTPALDKRFTGATRARGIFLALLLGAERQSGPGAINPKPLLIEDSKHREYSVDDNARLALDQSGLEPLDARRITAKTPVEGWVVFDVDPDARGLRLKVLDPGGESTDYAFIKLP